MIAKRIIPCLDVRAGRVVKGVNFKGVADVDDPVELAKRYNAEGADELVFYDITASAEGRKLFTDILERVASEVFIPLTVGGGISSISDFKRALDSGADKVSVNSGAITNPRLIADAAEKYGSQCVVLSLDVKRADGRYALFKNGGRIDTGLDALEFAALGERLGAGELVVNSIDTDGVKNGFDLKMLTAFTDTVGLPVIASGGAGRAEDFISLFALDGVDAGIFHFGEVKIGELKKLLAGSGVPVRI